jgi:formylglycine-generating enzyme required for sulfatase activity
VHPGFPVPGGKFAPNPWGLYDITGNAWEWCQDRYGRYPKKAVTDPTGPDSGSRRSVRGGSAWSFSRHCRSAARAWNGQDDSFFNLGFRVVRE